MSNGANKQIVVRLFECISANNVDGVVDLVTDDCIWNGPGRTESFALGAPKNKQGIRELFEMIAALFPVGLLIKAKSFTCEGNRVAAEAASVGNATNGRV